MAEQHELEAAYFHQLRQIGDMDGDVARDLGYLTSPEEFEATLVSHQQFKQPTAAEQARQADYSYYQKEFHLSGNNTLTDEQLAINKRGIAAARAFRTSKER